MPYGIYDLTANTGWVNVGTDDDTGAFAVASIRSWWEAIGRQPTPAAGGRRSPLIPAGPTARGCGCGRPSWPRSPQKPAWTSRCCTCHREPANGTNRHSLFSATTTQLAGSLLVSHEVIIETISAVTTRTGLKVTAVLDTGLYPRGIRIPDKDMKAFEARHLKRHEFHGNWNYTLPARSRAARPVAVRHSRTTRRSPGSASRWA